LKEFAAFVSAENTSAVARNRRSVPRATQAVAFFRRTDFFVFFLCFAVNFIGLNG
jgi:hypothetical protein